LNNYTKITTREISIYYLFLITYKAIYILKYGLL